MRCLESTFLIDLLKGEAAAVQKAEALVASKERLSVAAPVVTEILLGAYFKGGHTLKGTLELLSSMDVLNVDADVAAEAGRMGASLLKRGISVPTVDLLIAATAKLNQCILVTRDASYARIPDLAIETY